MLQLAIRDKRLQLIALDFHSPISAAASPAPVFMQPQQQMHAAPPPSLRFVELAVGILQGAGAEGGDCSDAVTCALQLLQKGLLGHQLLQSNHEAEGRASAAATPPPMQYVTRNSFLAPKAQTLASTRHACDTAGLTLRCRLRASAEFVTLAQHEKDAAAAASGTCGGFDAEDDGSDGLADVLEQLQALNEKKRDSLLVPMPDIAPDADADADADSEPCVLEMQQRTKGLFRR